MISVFITETRRHPTKPGLLVFSCPRCKAEQTTVQSGKPRTLCCAKCFSSFVILPEEQQDRIR